MLPFSNLNRCKVCIKESLVISHFDIHRLQQLESAMVGGEQAANEELKQKRKKKLKHVEERRLRLAGLSFVSTVFHNK